MDENINHAPKVAVFGGGCFWCLEALFQQVRGVLAVEPGYAGGNVNHPTYEEVCTGTTGHAEVVRVTYDEKLVSYEQLVQLFFHVHDPTTLNQQGNDVGTQYRSVLFYANKSEQATALRVMGKIEGEKLWPRPLVTQLVPLEVFWPAEEYHRNYFASHPSQGYCQFVIAPKVAKFRHQYPELLR